MGTASPVWETDPITPGQPDQQSMGVNAAETPWTVDEPHSAQAAPQTAPLTGSSAAPIVGNTVDQKGFADQLPYQTARRLPPEVEKQIVSILANDPVETAANHAREVLHGVWPGNPENFDHVIDMRRKGAAVGSNINYPLPDPKLAADATGQSLDAGAAAVRGAGGIIAPVNTADSVLHAAQDWLTGENKSPVDAFHRWEDINFSVQNSDELNHPRARLVGQLIGGLAIPSGMEGEALAAGKSVLRSGGSMQEARAAAAAAARTRVAAEGATIGAVHGFDTAAPGQGTLGAIEGGAAGGVLGYGLTGAAQQVGIPVGKNAADAVSRFLQRVGVKDTAEATDSPDYVQLARELNIRRTPATNSGSGVSTVMQAGLGALPGGAPVSAAADREVSDLANTAKATAEGVGNVSSRQGAGEAIAQGAQDYAQTSKGVAKGLYQQRDALVGGSNTAVPTDRTSTALQDIASRFPNSPAIQQLREHPAIRAIGGALPGEPTTEQVPTGILDANGNSITRTVTSGGQPLNLGEVTEALSHVRSVQRNLAAQNNTSGPVLARVSQVEQGLEDDVMNAAKNADAAAGRTPGAPGSAVKAQQDADTFYADRASALNGSLKKPLKSANDDTQMSGEAVYNQVSGDMDAKTGNLARLRDAWFRLPDQAKSTFAATKIDDLGRALPGQQNDANSAWSFQTFLTNLNKLSPQARNIVFGPQADSQLQKIATYASRLRQLDRARNFSNTAQKYFAGAFMATVGGAVMHGDLGSAAEAAGALPAAWGGAKLLMATPAMRDWTAQALKTVTAGNEVGLKVLTKKLSSIASADPTIANDALGLQQTILKAANDNLRSLAASGGQENPQKQSKQANGPR